MLSREPPASAELALAGGSRLNTRRSHRFGASHPGSAQKQARLPADALGRGPQLLQRPVLDLPHALLADAEQVADLPQAVRAVAGQPEAQVEHLPLARTEVL